MLLVTALRSRALEPTDHGAYKRWVTELRTRCPACHMERAPLQTESNEFPHSWFFSASARTKRVKTRSAFHSPAAQVEFLQTHGTWPTTILRAFKSAVLSRCAVRRDFVVVIAAVLRLAILPSTPHVPLPAGVALAVPQFISPGPCLRLSVAASHVSLRCFHMVVASNKCSC